MMQCAARAILTPLLGFLQETYAAAADLAKWDRNVLERAYEGQDSVDAPQVHLGRG